VIDAMAGSQATDKRRPGVSSSEGLKSENKVTPNRLVSPSAEDQHPRVRFGFLQCLGQLCTDCEASLAVRSQHLPDG
jgi:hypothetical protein